MHPFLRHAFLGQNYAYYMRDFTVSKSEGTRKVEYAYKF